MQEPPNAAVLTAVFNHIRAFGEATWPPAKKILPLVSDVDLKAKILKKVKYMRSQYGKNKKNIETAAAVAAARQEQLDEDEEDTIEVERLERSMKNSRAESVSFPIESLIAPLTGSLIGLETAYQKARQFCLYRFQI